MFTHASGVRRERKILHINLEKFFLSNTCTGLREISQKVLSLRIKSSFGFLETIRLFSRCIHQKKEEEFENIVCTSVWISFDCRLNFFSSRKIQWLFGCHCGRSFDRKALSIISNTWNCVLTNCECKKSCLTINWCELLIN